MSRQTLDATIRGIAEEIDYPRNPYFRALRDGSFSKDDFVETQIQFYSAVVFFSRPMAALAAKIPESALRMEILRNVWEEHGEGDPSQVHSATFIAFLERLGGVGPTVLAGRALWPEVRIFNTTLAGACVLDEYLVGAALMGMIERMFSEISTIIGRAVVERGWLTADRLIHYTLHEELDVKHSRDFFDVLAPSWERSEEDRYYIEQGLRMGATLFNGLYAGLYAARGRRRLRDTRGPHSRV